MLRFSIFRTLNINCVINKIDTIASLQFNEFYVLHFLLIKHTVTKKLTASTKKFYTYMSPLLFGCSANHTLIPSLTAQSPLFRFGNRSRQIVRWMNLSSLCKHRQAEANVMRFFFRIIPAPQQTRSKSRLLATLLPIIALAVCSPFCCDVDHVHTTRTTSIHRGYFDKVRIYTNIE